jgi:hypothetical protein
MRKACLVLTVMILTVFALSGCKEEIEDDPIVPVVVPASLNEVFWSFGKDGYWYITKIIVHRKEIDFSKQKTGYDSEGNEFPFDIRKSFKILEVQTVSGLEKDRTTLFCNTDKTKDYVVCEENRIIIVTFGEYYFSRNTMELQ